jgi:hypothetical protein
LPNNKPEIIEEHAVVLNERRTAMSAPDAQFFTWEEAQQVLANRKKMKNKDNNIKAVSDCLQY